MPDSSHNLNPAFWLGIVAGALALRYARGPYSAWFAHLPGTLAHELAHYLVAFITGSRPSPISLRLERKQGGWVLGSVRFTPGRLSAGFVALAPLYLLPLLALALWPSGDAAGTWSAAAQGYVFVMIGFSAAPSSTDWAIASKYPLGTLAVLLAIGFGLATAFGVRG